MKVVLVFCALVCGLTLVVNAQFEFPPHMMMTMLMTEQRCQKCKMCDLADRYCGICDPNMKSGICAFCQNSFYCFTDCVGRCGRPAKPMGLMGQSGGPSSLGGSLGTTDLFTGAPSSLGGGIGTTDLMTGAPSSLGGGLGTTDLMSILGQNSLSTGQTSVDIGQGTGQTTTNQNSTESTATSTSIGGLSNVDLMSLLGQTSGQSVGQSSLFGSPTSQPALNLFSAPLLSEMYF